MKIKVDVHALYILRSATLEELNCLVIEAKKRIDNCNAIFPLTMGENNHIREKRMIPAIKAIRERTGMGLKECKDAVEAKRAEFD